MQFWSSDSSEEDIASWLASRGDGFEGESWTDGADGAAVATAEVGDWGSGEPA
jgi:hypothetical protein